MEQDILNELITIKSILMILILTLGFATFMVFIEVFFPARVDRYKDRSSFRSTCTQLFENGSYQALIKRCNTELGKNPQSSIAYWFLGRAHFALSQYEDAKTAFHQSINIDPLLKKDYVAPFLEKIEEQK